MTSAPIIPLTYANRPRWTQRRGVLWGITLATLISALSLPIGLQVKRAADQRQAARNAILTLVSIRRQEIEFRIGENLNTAYRATEQARFADARAAVDNATVARDADAQLFSFLELTLFTFRIDLAKQTIKTSAANHTTWICGNVTISPNYRHEEHIQRRNTLAALIEKSQDQIRRRNYAAAIVLCQQVLDIDPSNDYAKGAMPLLLDKELDEIFERSFHPIP